MSASLTGMCHDGLTVEELFGQAQGWTFDDVIALPIYAKAVDEGSVGLACDLAAGFPLRLPIVSSPMDTITEWRTAVHMALNGGIGILHMNLSVAEAAGQVRRVKRSLMGVIDNPLCRKPSDPVLEVDQVKRKHEFSTILITESGQPGSKLLGMVTKGHVGLVQNEQCQLRDVMIPADQLVTRLISDVRTFEQALQALRDAPAASKLPLLDKDGNVLGLVTRDDVAKRARHPSALVDSQTGQLMVGAAVSTHEKDIDRVKALVEAGVDVIVIDSSHGGSEYVVRRIKEIADIKSSLPVIAGNVVTPDEADPLIEAGALALRVGRGSGSICTTQEVLGTGRAQLSAVYSVSNFVRRRGVSVPVIADGGIRNSGDIFKALACGAATVMLGRRIAGCPETPGEEVIDSHGRACKRYRGMGSPSAMRAGGCFRYDGDLSRQPMVPQGVEGFVSVQPSLDRVLPELGAAIRSGLVAYGCVSIEQLHELASMGKMRFELRSASARKEGKPHDINYNPIS